MKKVYLITGASSDIGMAFLHSASQKDTDSIFYATYRTFSEEIHELKSALGDRLCLIQADLSTPEGVQTIIHSVEEVPTHILHLPASKLIHKRLKQIDIMVIDKEMQIQVYSLIELYKYFLPKMAKQKYGRCVSIVSSSVEGLPPKFMTEYIIVKSALLGLVRSLSVEYAPKGIFINAVSPHMVQTKLLQDIDDRLLENLANASPLGRHLTPHEIVMAIEFLFSDDNPMFGRNLII